MNKHIGVIAGIKNKHADLMIEAMEKKGILTKRFSINNVVAQIGKDSSLLHRGDDLSQLDAVLVRGIPGGSLEQVVFRMDLLYTLSRKGVLVMNGPAAIEKTVDKYFTTALLEEQGLRTPKTVVVEKAEAAMEALRSMGDVVIKPLFGSMGNGIIRLDNEAAAKETFKELENNARVFYLQQFVDHGCEDIRAFVIGDEVVAAMVRKGDHWLTNLSKGAKPIPTSLKPEIEETCIKAVKAIGADYGGVDLMIGDDGLTYVIEVNSVPGWLGLQKVTEVNIPERLVQYLLKRLT